MSVTTMKKAINLRMGVINSADYRELLKSGDAEKEIDGITRIRGFGYVISDEAFTRDLFNYYTKKEISK